MADVAEAAEQPLLLYAARVASLVGAALTPCLWRMIHNAHPDGLYHMGDLCTFIQQSCPELKVHEGEPHLGKSAQLERIRHVFG